MLKFCRVAVVLPFMLGAAEPALAQQQEGLVNVNLSEIVIQEIASDINVEVSQIPATVQVPVGVAANICDVNANVLAEQKKNGEATCDATSTSQALNQVVQKQIKG